MTQSKQLEKISKELFGDKWIIPLAECLEITRQAVYLWIADKRKIPKVVFMALTMKKQLDKIPDRWKKAIG